MSGRSPARLLAPIALVLFVVAFFAVVSSGGGGGGEREEEAGRPAATTQPTRTSAEDEEGTSAKGGGTRTYTVKTGDTPSSIAQKESVSLQQLSELNPEMDPNTLQPGQKLKLPR